MYIPARYKVTDDQLIDDFIRANGFATLFTSGSGGPMATHIPVELERAAEGRRFHGHVSKGNPQWKQLAETGEALLVFLGPHCYVTPTWYDHPNVPTWNYQSVHVTGKVRIFDAPTELAPDLRALSQHYEPPTQPPPRFDFDAMPAELRDAEIKGVVGFELIPAKVEAAFKLSQNRNDGDFARIIRELEARGDDASRAIAAAMRRLGRTAG